jgi:membrane protein implicated in regulation of membrane protease activity
MTNFYAMYLFLILAIVLLIVGLIFKHPWLFYLSAIGWLATGLYCVSIYTPAATYVAFFATFCFLAALAMIIAPTFINQKPKEEIAEEDNYTRMANSIDRLRGTTERFKAKGKDVIL